MRPTYEKQNDRVNQFDVAKSYLKKGYEIEEMPPFFGFDVGFSMNKELKAVAEIKCRTHRHGTFPTYMISAEKYNKLCVFSQYSKIVTLLIVRWSCGTIGHVSLPTDASFFIGGRTDRNDPKDKEIVAHIPIHKFTIKNQSHQ